MNQPADVERVRRIVAVVRLAVARAGEALERAKHPEGDHDMQAAIAMARAAVVRSRALLQRPAARLECPVRPAAKRFAATAPQWPNPGPERQDTLGH